MALLILLPILLTLSSAVNDTIITPSLLIITPKTSEYYSTTSTLNMSPSNDSSTQNSMIEFLDVIDLILYSQLFIFIGLGIFILLISKLWGCYKKHDEIRYSYFIYFILFSLNFVNNSIILILRIFEQQQYILGGCAVLILFITRLYFDLSITINSKSIWTKSAFISKVNSTHKKTQKCKA